MPRVVARRRGLFVTAGGAAMVVAALSGGLPACNALLDDFVYVDASVPPGDEVTPGLDAGASDASTGSASDAASLVDTGPGADGDDSGDDDGGLSPLTYQQVILNAKPLAYWRLDEMTGPTATSLTNPGTYNAAYHDDVMLQVPGAIAGDTDTAIRFSGDTGAVLLQGGFSSFGARTFTIELWMRPTVAATNVFSFLVKAAAPTASAQIIYQESGGSALHGVEYLDGPATYDNSKTDPVVSAWSYVVLASDGTDLQLFVNGHQVDVESLQNLGADAGDAGDGGTSFSIGGDENGYSSFTGDIDEVAVYGRQLGNPEVLRHYFVGIGYDAGP